MTFNFKHTATVFATVSMTAALVACGGANGDATQAAPESTGAASAESVDHAAQAEGVSKYTVTVSPDAGGKVNSLPAALHCKAEKLSGCSADFTANTQVTLTATPAVGYTFTGWTGACKGTDDCTGTITSAISVGATFAKKGGGGGGSAPIVSYIDALSGPTTGGENNAGTYLSIFGSNFGSASGLGTTTKVYIGGVEVANYRYLGASKVAGKLGLQQITVQVGNLGLPQGQAEPVKVVVNGTASNTDSTFTPNPGRILFVSLSGNDSTAVPGDITHPYRHLQTSTGGGAHGVMRAGDHIVIRGGNWNDQGMDGAWLRFRYPQQEGTKPTGASGTGWIHFTAYPGPINGNAVEDVHYTTPAGVKGGFQGANSAYYGTTGDYISISNLRMDVDGNAESDAAPVNVQYSAGPWRVVNNELGPWPSKIGAKAAGVAGHGDGTTVLGNYIHDIACTGASENHGIYADSGAMNWNIGYNWIQNIPGGNLIQFFDNVGAQGNSYQGYPAKWQGFTGMMVHHNWMESGGKYGLNMADGIVSGSIWNNVIKGATYAGLRINTISKNMDMTVAYNTFYDNDRVASGSGNAQVLNTWGNYNPTGTIRLYDNIFAAGPGTLKTSSFYENPGATDAYLDFKRNLYYDNNYGWGGFSRDPSAVIGNPKFTNATGGDLTLATGSLAIDQASQSVPLTVNDDMTRLVKRPQGGAPDIGAYEKTF